MIDREHINAYLGITESYQASPKLTALMADPVERERLFDAFISWGVDLAEDTFTDYFQEEHSNKTSYMQDFTPEGIAAVAAGVLGKTLRNADLCAGTGQLTIKMWAANPDAVFYCEEMSSRAFPFLLFNMAIRNMEGWALRGNTLTREFEECCRLTRGERYSHIEQSEPPEPHDMDTVIMNPPYSQKWEHTPDLITEPRFYPYGKLAPKSKADYAFILTGFDMLGNGGALSAILPHGVLFRGGAEGTIREQLINDGAMDTIIGMPDKTFLHTAIPTAVMLLKKGRKERNTLFILASEDCRKEGRRNIVEPQHVQKILGVFGSRSAVNRYSELADIATLADNDFNLNIPLYVDTYIPKPVTPFQQLADEFIQIDQKIERTGAMLSTLAQDLTTDKGEIIGGLGAMQRYLLNRYGLAKQDEIDAANRAYEERDARQAERALPEPMEEKTKGEQLNFYDQL